MEKGEETNVYAVCKRVNGKQRREISVLLFCTTHLVTGQSQFQDRRKSKLVAVGWVRSVKFCCANEVKGGGGGQEGGGGKCRVIY
jgi:hypothetical protein